jgi:hypothetical protein
MATGGSSLDGFRRLPAVAAMAAAAVSQACSIDVNAEGSVLTETRTLAVTGQPELRLATHDGSIELRGWDRQEIMLEIRRRAATDEEARALAVTVTQEGNRIEVEAPGGSQRRRVIRFGGWGGEGVSFIVRAPRRLALDAATRDGSIAVEDLSGSILLDSGDGSIRGERLEGSVKAHTGDGSIALIDAAGKLDLDSGDGSIRVSGRLDELVLRTGDGSVSVDADSGSAMAADWSVTSGDGSITLNLPSPFNAEVEAQSGDGDIRVLSPEARVRQHDDPRTFRGRLGTGGRTIHARSGDGSITIASR